MNWAAFFVGSDFDGDSTVKRGISLGDHQLAQAYERTTVFSKFYAASALPTDDELTNDLVKFCGPLQKLYRAQELRLSPGQKHADVIAIEEEVQKIAAPLRASTGQGRGLSAPLRKLVELHAMERARDWLEVNGFNAKDVSASDSCDFRAKKDVQEWIIEVKGTTGGPGSILLTKNEVDLHHRTHPLNILIVIHGISLDQIQAEVSGGDMIVEMPWRLDKERLSPVCYEYKL